VVSVGRLRHYLRPGVVGQHDTVKEVVVVEKLGHGSDKATPAAAGDSLAVVLCRAVRAS
jgi:hypothetical protein